MEPPTESAAKNFWGQRTPTEKGCLVLAVFVAFSLFGQCKLAFENWANAKLEDSKDKDRYQEGLQALEAKNFERAHQILTEIAAKLPDVDTTGALAEARDGHAGELAAKAEKLRSAGTWLEATSVLEQARALGPGSEAQAKVEEVAKRIYPLAYAEGVKALESKEWDRALEFLKAARTHKDAQALKERAAYELGLVWISEKSWKFAVEYLAQAGDHKDAKEKLKIAQGHLNEAHRQRQQAQDAEKRIKDLFKNGQHLMIGDQGYLVSESGMSIPAAASEAAHGRMTKAITSGDDLGLQNLRQAGQVALVEAGTPVRRIGAGGTLGSLAEVRIEGGPLLGQSVWVSYAFAKK